MDSIQFSNVTIDAADISLAATGLWLRLCRICDNGVYNDIKTGRIRLMGHDITSQEIAFTTGNSVKKIEKLLLELKNAGLITSNPLCLLTFYKDNAAYFGRSAWGKASPGTRTATSSATSSGGSSVTSSLERKGKEREGKERQGEERPSVETGFVPPSHEPVDDFSHFRDWFLYCWPNDYRKCSNLVETEATVLLEKHGWPKLRDAMKKAAGKAWTWGSVENLLNEANGGRAFTKQRIPPEDL